MDLTTILIIAAIAIFIIVIAVISVVSTNKIKKNGLEADAVVSKIEKEIREVIHEDTGMVDTDTNETYYVKYRTENGEEVEAKLINPKMNLKEGDTLRIKYLPEKPNRALRI